MKYSEQIKSPKWQKKRLEILSLRGFKCEKCKSEDEQLHVHHRFYIEKRKAWEYDNDVFQVLCHICHKNEHTKKESVQKYPEIVELIDKFYLENDYDYLKLILEISIRNLDPDFINNLGECFNLGLEQDIYNYVKLHSDCQNSLIKQYLLEEELKALKSK